MIQSRIASVLILFFTTGCIGFHAKPLDPQETAMQFEARSLNDSGLKDFVSKNQKNLTGWPPQAWDFSLLTLAAFYYHSDLDLARAQSRVTSAAIQTAKERPNPTLSVGPEYASNVEPGIMSWILGLTVDIPLETAGKRGYRVAQAQAMADAARLHIAQVAWTVRGRVRSAMLALYAARRTQEILQAQSIKLNENRRLYEKRSRDGYVSPLTLTQAQVLVGKTQLLLADAERQELDSRHLLAQALGLPIQGLAGIALALPDFENPSVVNPEALRPLRQQAVLRRPDLLEALALYAASQAALQLEIAKQYPDVHLGPGYLYDQGTHKWGLAASSVLPIMNQNHGAIAEAAAKREQAARQFIALQETVIADVDRTLADYNAARQKLETAMALLVTHKQQDQRLQKLLHPGDVSRLTLFRTQLDLDSTRLLVADALLQFQLARGALEDALGQSLPDSYPALPTVDISC